jgi:protein involved in polysaccharide export with SLBB domain
MRLLLWARLRSGLWVLWDDGAPSGAPLLFAVDSEGMSDSTYGGGSRILVPCPACSRPNSSLRMMRQLGLLLLMSSLAVGVPAQQTPSGYPDSSTQTTTSPDCSDPAQAGSAQCSAQNQNLGGQQLTPQTRTALPGAYGSQSAYPNNNYSDTEQLSRGTPRGQAQQQLQTILPPEHLTEFQKFIASTTGQVLPIFGANLFRNVPSTFAPLSMTPVPSDYVIGPEDELRVRVWGQVSFQANVRVDRSGEIYLPQVGPVHVAGIPFSALDGQLRSAIGRVYRNFDLTADIGQIRAVQVYVAGEARHPGVYTVSSLSTLVDAIFASGGPSIQGSMRDIELRRGSQVVAVFDLYDLLARGDKSKDAKLLPGDVIFITPVGAEVAITGSVRNQAIYELSKGESLDGLIADAGGVSAVASKARVSIERIEDNHDRYAMEVAYDAAGLKTALADGDLVHVFSIVPQYQKTVTLRGNTANPGRFAWHAGMHVSDLVPDKDSLITRNYWWKRSQLGLAAPEFEPLPNLANLRQPMEERTILLNTRPQHTMGQQGGGLQPSQYGLQQNGDGSQSNAYRLQQNGYGSQQDGDESQQNDDGAQSNAYGPQQNGYGSQQNDPGAQLNEYGAAQNQRLGAQQRAGSSSLAAQQNELQGSVPSAGERTEVRQLAPEIDWDYAVIERLDRETLKTVLLPFDLGKLVMQHDASQDLELQAGDVLSIFSEADIRVPIAHQTKLITLSGEFVHAGVYTVQPGETFRDLVERAGGLTPNAYLYGSEYTRESTRVTQQSRIDEYVQSLSMEIQRANLSIAASPVSTPQDIASGAASQISERDLIASLRQIRATGRIVMNFTPDSSDTTGLPDITMENGDQFIVPPKPAIVNVVGAVYDQSSFLYTQGRRSGEYLKLAGGPNRDADWKHEFLIRADGEVVDHAGGGGAWGNKFNNLRMYPGDTIVVPEKTFKAGALRGLLDWSQVVSQFGLGAAAITVLK